MSVERWLRLIAGLFVAGTVLLGVTVSPWFFAFTAFVGLNLIQSAFTNWCPMMWVVRKLGAPPCQTEEGHAAQPAGRTA
ncbi:MAG: YgaP family membrane protein [Chthonomonadales bacterium]